MADNQKKQNQGDQNAEDQNRSAAEENQGNEEFYSEISRGQSGQNQDPPKKENQDEDDSGMGQSEEQ